MALVRRRVCLGAPPTPLSRPCSGEGSCQRPSEQGNQPCLPTFCTRHCPPRSPPKRALTVRDRGRACRAAGIEAQSAARSDRHDESHGVRQGGADRTSHRARAPAPPLGVLLWCAAAPSECPGPAPAPIAGGGAMPAAERAGAAGCSGANCGDGHARRAGHGERRRGQGRVRWGGWGRSYPLVGQGPRSRCRWEAAHVCSLRCWGSRRARNTRPAPCAPQLRNPKTEGGEAPKMFTFDQVRGRNPLLH